MWNRAPLRTLIPAPALVMPAAGAFTIAPATRIAVWPNDPELCALGDYLAERLRPATGYPLHVAPAEASSPGNISLTLVEADPGLGDEGYELHITPDDVRLSALRPAGLFYGIQTIRQVLPPAIESDTPRPGPWHIPAGTIRDAPRFPWRGAMLDVARHFFPVAHVKRLLDLMALYKLNRLHLHLTDDQGWRIEIKSWPRLAAIGGSTQVGGGPGGHYTQADYAEIVRYAAGRYITIVPEIDMPGHTNAALAAYPELACDGRAPALYTGTEVGFSSLCTTSEIVYRFLDDVIGEVAALTPGPYFHIGGDEASATPETEYRGFVERVQGLVARHGKRMIGWEEIAAAALAPSAIVQYWNTPGHNADLVRTAAARGSQVILSPASRTYLDMQYGPDCPLGLNWAGYLEVEEAYDWDPAGVIPGLPSERILGIEAPLWTETVRCMAEIEFMAFPRLAGHAEIAWSAAEARSWEEYRHRLAGHGPRWQALGVNFYRSPQVAWT
ncbi:MAG: beta-N-acetylhexosaminidase [Anaerolineae bacterium]|nr:beta-N-acetylhexosaminidase [Anaerolineae bacterium]